MVYIFSFFVTEMAIKCKQLGTSIISVLEGLENGKNIVEKVKQSINDVKAMSDFAETLQGTLKENPIDLLADMVENELSSMDKAIEEAAKIMQAGYLTI